MLSIIVQDILTEVHGNLLVGHDGIYKTKERLLQCYYWPGMDADIAHHIKTCSKKMLKRRMKIPIFGGFFKVVLMANLFE
jgi:Integrase zinc binding domain